MSNKLIRLFKEPLLQFLIIGAAIYGAYALFAAPEDDYRDTVVRVDSNRIDAMISEWESRWNRPPTARKSTRLNSRHRRTSDAVSCLK